MTPPKTEKRRNGLDANGELFNLFAKNDGFWWPYRSFAKALLATQKDASAYLESNRDLIDEMRDIVRREQDLSLEISQKALEKVVKKGSAGGNGMADPQEVNAIFDRAMMGLQELGEAWMNAQMRSLDAMRSHAANALKQPPARRSERPMAAE
jgi:hypothetical protein